LALAENAPCAERYSFKYYSHEEGLTALAVFQLHQDRRGFLWAGTVNGLFRYDGARFTRFDRRDGLPGVRIRAIHETASGTLWVGSDAGLSRLRGARFETVPLPGDAGPVGRFAIDSGPDGSLYVGTGTALYSGRESENGRIEFERVSGSYPTPVHAIHTDSKGLLWFGCGKKLCRLDRANGVRVLEKDGLDGGPWQRILTDRAGALWIRSTTRLLERPAGTGEFEPRDAGLPQASISPDLCLDPAGELLVSTDLGLAARRGSGWRLIGTQNGLEAEAVTALMLDREGSIWLALWGNGVARWQGWGEWRSWNQAGGLNNGAVWGIHRRAPGSVWVGTDNGLSEIADSDPARPARPWSAAEGLAGQRVRALEIGPDGEVWAGSLSGGVWRLDPRRSSCRRYGSREGLDDDRVLSLLLDSEQRLWAGTVSGLFRSGPVTAANAGFEKQLPAADDGPESFYRVLADREGRIWAAGARGLARLEGGRWTRFTSKDGLRFDSVTQVAQAGDGALWVAYRNAVGTSRLKVIGDRVEAEHHTMAEGLPSDFVVFLGSDSTGAIWAGTDRGAGRFENGAWRHFGRADGLIWDSCSIDGFLAEPDGAVWIGTQRGVSCYRPSKLARPRLPPSIYVTAVLLGDKKLDPSQAGLKVPFGSQSLSFAFASPTFLNEKETRFRYRLTGLESGWNLTERNEARYTALGAGRYTFEVSSRNAAGDWSLEPARFQIEVLPPWWNSPWFRVLAATAIPFLFFLAVHWRVRHFVRERERLARAVRERTTELEERNATVEAQKREIEHLLEQTRAASRLKSEFLANMSHEIRTPMNGIIGMASLALMSESPGEQRQCLEMVRSCGNSLLTLLNEILDLSKIEADRLELNLVPFSLRDLIQETVRMLAPVAGQGNLRLVCEMAETLPEAFIGDPARIRQILFNLVGNAIKFTPRGKVRVRVALEGPGPDAGRAPVHISVSDTGIGIAPDHLDVIFEPFRQADGTTTRRYGGTGLGLAICARLVQAMNGRIWAESEQGKGSTFHFVLDLALAGAPPEPPPFHAAFPEEQTPPRPLRILVAEDNLVNQRLMQRLLEKAGHSPIIAEDGMEALRLLETEPVNLVLMDVQMPHLDGLKTTARIRDRERTTGDHVPVVALTAHAMSGDREKCLQAGMDAYISKPVRPEELLSTIQRFAR
jgi:signal transduction histidine kinase/ligand-binding sensor domain-containing protein/CheY-like chemotaxis protein